MKPESSEAMHGPPPCPALAGSPRLALLLGVVLRVFVGPYVCLVAAGCDSRHTKKGMPRSGSCQSGRSGRSSCAGEGSGLEYVIPWVFHSQGNFEL